MGLFSIVIALAITSLISMIIGTIWYSQHIGLGLIYIKNYWGSKSIYDTNCTPKQNREKAALLCLVFVIAYNGLLMFLLASVYQPKNINDTLYMALALTAIHFLQELPHIAYEVRSIGALMIHTGFHYLLTSTSLLVLRYYFNMPKQ